MLFERFAEKTLWQQQLILAVFMLLFWSVGYFMILKPLQQQYQNLQYDYLDRIANHHLIEQKIAQYPTKLKLEEERERLIQEHKSYYQNSNIKEKQKLLTDLILQSRLTLFSSQKINQQDSLIWSIELYGEYFDFLAFLQAIKRHNMTITIDKLSIYKQPSSLVFLLSVACK